MSQPELGGPESSTASCGSGSLFEKNVNMALNEIAMQNGCVPEWILLSESGPQHQKVFCSSTEYKSGKNEVNPMQRFTWQLSMGQYTTSGTGHSKKIAK